MSPFETRVVLFQVRDVQRKLQRITETARLHFEKKEPLLFVVEDEKAQNYVDELLWKFPEASLLPHFATDEATPEKIAITKAKKNVNGALVAFNLCATPLLFDGPFRLIYDFEDLTSSPKKNLFCLRFDAYKKAHFIIESRS